MKTGGQMRKKSLIGGAILTDCLMFRQRKPSMMQVNS